MSEIKTEIKQNPDGSYTITDAHSTADVVRWLLTQDSKETILYLLSDTPQRTWVGLADEDIDKAGMKLAECMDYPWEHMPEEGKRNMRDHAKAIIEAAHGIKELA